MVTIFVVLLSYQCPIHLANNLFTAEDIDEVEVQVRLGVLEDTILVHAHLHLLGPIPARPGCDFALVVKTFLCCLICNAWRLI